MKKDMLEESERSITIKGKKMKDKKGYNQLAYLSGFAFTMIVIIAISVFVGIWLDNQFTTDPLFTIIFSLLGMFAGIFNLIRNIIKLEERNGKK